jgi:hypothetical protein
VVRGVRLILTTAHHRRATTTQRVRNVTHTPELEFIKLNPKAVLLDLRTWYAPSSLKTIGLGPLTKKSNSLNLYPSKSIDYLLDFRLTVFNCEYELSNKNSVFTDNLPQMPCTMCSAVYKAINYIRNFAEMDK